VYKEDTRGASGRGRDVPWREARREVRPLHGNKTQKTKTKQPPPIGVSPKKKDAIAGTGGPYAKEEGRVKEAESHSLREASERAEHRDYHFLTEKRLRTRGGYQEKKKDYSREESEKKLALTRAEKNGKNDSK